MSALPDGWLTELLSGFPVVETIKVAWGEMDAMPHVNNAACFRYFESGRMAELENHASGSKPVRDS